MNLEEVGRHALQHLPPHEVAKHILGMLDDFLKDVPDRQRRAIFKAMKHQCSDRALQVPY